MTDTANTFFANVSIKIKLFPLFRCLFWPQQSLNSCYRRLEWFQWFPRIEVTFIGKESPGIGSFSEFRYQQRKDLDRCIHFVKVNSWPWKQFHKENLKLKVSALTFHRALIHDNPRQLRATVENSSCFTTSQGQCTCRGLHAPLDLTLSTRKKRIIFPLLSSSPFQCVSASLSWLIEASSLWQRLQLSL